MPHQRLDLSALPALYREHVGNLTRLYATVMAEHGLDAVVLHSGRMTMKSVFDDQFWPFVAVPHTRHWAPIETPDSLIVIRPGSTPELVLNMERGYWDGAPVYETDHFWASFDVVEMTDATAVGSRIPKGRVAFVGEDTKRAYEWGFAPDAVAPHAVMHALDSLRVEKSAYEVLCLAEANRRAGVGHAAVVEAFRSGEQTELDLHLTYLRATRQDDAETPYKNIVALGDHAATLHHVHYSKKAGAIPAQSLLLDAGASFCGYDSDITRTVVKGESGASEAFSALLDEMNQLQQKLCVGAVPGRPFEDLHNESHRLLADALRAVGIADASTEELVDSGATRKFYPHGLGHSLGIQTHDVGCRRIEPEVRNPALRNTSTIAPGQVFTIEPGCYFIDSLLDDLRSQPIAGSIDWSLVDALKPFGGIRIEDDIHVVTGGPENLTRPYFSV